MADVLKTYMDNAAGECSLAAPSVFYNNTDTSYAQLKRYMYRTAEELRQRHDWAYLTRDQSISGADTDTYALADDFDRMCRRNTPDDPAVWSSTLQRPYYPVVSNAEWTVLTALGGSHYGYRVVGSNIQFTETVATGTTIKLAYISKSWILNGGNPTQTWSSDADYTKLPGILIEMGTTWRWRRKRGLEFSSYQGEYEMELSRRSNDDRNIRVIHFGSNASAEAFRSPYDGVDVPTLGPAP